MRDRYASLREGLVGAWIPSVSGSGLLLPDLSGNGNNGTLTNMGPEDWVSSQYGRALDFDGSNDYVELGFATQMQVGSSNFSIASWVNTDATGSLQTIVFTGLQKRYLLRLNADNTALAEIDDDTTLKNTASTTVLSQNTWYHIFAQRNKNKLELFVDGIIESFVDITGYGSLDNVTPNNTRIGVTTTTVAYFNGQLDDIRIYNRALSEPEIKLLASRPGIGLRPQRRTMYYAPPTGARRRRILTSMP